MKSREAGPLDRKTQDLIKQGISVGNSSREAVMSHTRKALKCGATKDEIMHAVMLTLTTAGFSSMVAAFGGGTAAKHGHMSHQALGQYIGLAE